MFIIYAAGTVIIWIKTFFFAPFEDERKLDDEKFSTFNSSAFGRLLSSRKPDNLQALENIDDDKDGKTPTEPILLSLKSLRFWLLVWVTIFFI